RIDGAAAPAGAGWTIDVRVVDTAGDATVAAERVVVARRAELVARVGELAARLSAALAPGAPPPALAALTSGSGDAWQAYAGKDYRRALVFDPGFALARLALAADNPGELALARPLARGVAARRALRRLEATTPAALVAALEEERARAPHDLG